MASIHTLKSIYILCGIAGALSVLIVYLELKGADAVKYILKTVASLCFVIIGVLALTYAQFESWKALVLAALILGMLGDIFLSSGSVVEKGKNLDLLNLSGLIFFLLGHVVYIIWLIGFVESFNYLLLLIPFALPMIVIVLNALKVLELGKTAIPAVAYSAVIGLMLAAAINAYGGLSSYEISKNILAGGILFCISDSFLAYYNFGKNPKSWIKYVYMPAYYAAQLLFALAILH